MTHDRKILMIVAQYNFRDEEYEIPREIFERADFHVDVASEHRDDAFGKFGLKIWADLGFAEVSIHNYLGLVIVGGPGVMQLVHNAEVLNLVKEANQENKVIGAICAALSVLASAGLLEGKRVAVDTSQKEFVQEKGAIYSDAKLEIVDNIITASGPEESEEFAHVVVKALE